MAQKTWVVGEEVLAPDFNTYVQQQVVATFATVAARDAWGSPPNGALCVTLDTNNVWQRVAGAWVLFVPKAYLGQVFSGTVPPSGGTLLVASLTGLPLGTYRISHRCVANCQSAMLAYLQITGCSVALSGQANLPVGTNTLQIDVIGNVVGAGTVNITLQNAGTSTVTVYGDPQYDQLSAIRVA